MASASTRGLRSRLSRFSSPAHIVEKEADGNGLEVPGAKDRQKTSLDNWLEPPLRTPAPSFEDTKGLERIGVLEHMAPLGQLPPQKMLQKLKLGSHRPSLRATPAGHIEEVVTPSTEVEQMEYLSPAEIQMRPASVQPEEATPMSSPDRRSFSRQRNGEMSPRMEATPPPRKSSFTSSISASPKPNTSPRKWAADRVHFQIEHAIREAEQSGARNLIPGLRMLHKDALTDPKLWTILEAILNNSPSHDQFSVFKKYIKRGVKQFANTAPGEGYQIFQGPPYPFGSAQLRARSSSSTFQTINNSPGPSQTQPPSNTVSAIASPIRLKQLPAITQPQSPPTRSSPSPSKALAPSAMPSENGHPTEVPPESQSSPRRRRSRSASSSSSLSSAKSIPESFAPVIGGDLEAQVNGARPVRSSGQRQATNRVAAGSRSRSSAIIPTLSKYPLSDFNTASKFASKKLKRSREEIELDEAEIEKRRHDLDQQSFLGYNYIERIDVNERTVLESHQSPPPSLSVHVPPPVVHAHPLPPCQAALSSPVSLQAPLEHSLHHGRSRKRTYHEIDDDTDIPTPLSSSPSPLLVPLPPAGAVGSSRAATPRAAKLPPPGKKRKSARVMVSPNKPKNGGITAGISRAGPGRDSVIGNGADSSAEDNDEFCAACGGEGKLLCCDGCTNSFHHTCLEPPLDPEAEVDGEWFCPRCISRRNQGPIETTGVLGRVIRCVDDVIPKAFALPHEIRDYFEGVKTGDEGEYEEIGLPRTQNNAVKMNRAGFFEEPNYKELRDSKGHFITCHSCKKTSAGTRDIIPCDYCPARWHLDCLDPPLAVPPRRRQGDKPNATWRCPLHIEQDLVNIGRAAEAAPGDLGRIPRLRRPKNAIPFDVGEIGFGIPRGFRNNGVIDVELTEDKDPKFKTVDMRGRVIRLPEIGIRLDFIDRVKKSWYEDRTFPALIGRRKRIREELYRPSSPAGQMGRQSAEKAVEAKEGLSPAEAAAIEATAQANAVLRRKTFREQQAVLSLVGLAGDADTGAVSGDALADLTNQLVMDAPNEVGRLLQRDEVKALEKLLELTKARLAMLGALEAGDGGEAETDGKGMVNGIGKAEAVKVEEDEDDGSGSEMDITD